MIEGVVNDAYEAVVALSLQGATGQVQDIEAIIDAGYSGFLTLPATLVMELELPNPYEMVLQAAGGESVEIPWDFARHYCDPSYRPTVEATAALGSRTVGERVRRFRESAGLTQEELARAAHIGRVTLVRLENGEQSPRFRTLKAVAEALGMDTADLLVEPEFLAR